MMMTAIKRMTAEIGPMELLMELDEVTDIKK